MPIIHRRSSVLSRALVAGLVAFGLGSTEGRAEERVQDELISQLVHQTRIGDVVATSNGRMAFVVDKPAGRSHTTDIWTLEAGAVSPSALTLHGHASGPRWSPDGRSLALLSSENGPAQICVMAIVPGAARQLTHEGTDVQSYEWSPTGKFIVYATQASSSAAPSIMAANDAVVAGHSTRPLILKTVDAESDQIRQIPLDTHWRIGLYTWATDGAHLLVIASDGFQPEDVANQLLEVSVSDGSSRIVATLPGIAFSTLRASPDGASASFVASRNGPVAHDLYLQRLSGGGAINLTGKDSAAAVDQMVTDPQWLAPDRLMFSTQDGFGTAIYSLTLKTGKSTLARRFNDQALSSFAATRNGFFYAATGSTLPMELWENRQGRDRQLTHLNEPLTDLIAPTLFRYASADGFQIEAQLFTPPLQSGPCPLVVLVHPGPPRRWSHTVNDWAQVLVKRGVCALAPNIRGSSGYGEAFLVANRSDWGGGDFRDLMAGVDSLVAKGVADPDRLGIAGWSYGGFMSASAVTQTHRFKAAVAQSAMLDLDTQWETESAAIVAYDTWYLGTPWDHPETFSRLSPIAHVKGTRTPILLLAGAEDAINPLAQNWQFNRALRLNGVETELVVYPREGHAFHEEQHCRDVLERMAAWLSRYLVSAQP